jgi:hypothetical protein
MCLAGARDITFCGERIPIDNAFVSKKLMDVIRQQMPYANLPELRRDARKYFPMIEYCLKACNMPDDLKYIPIIESGFKNVTSKAGAHGFWQLMPATAMDWGLQVNASVDERNNIYKSTIAGLRELARTFKAIQRDHKISSWVLTAAAYNYGIGRLYEKIESGNRNYFSMKLNPETAVYVYKIIAIKELFEYPELYIKKFDYNVFNRNSAKQKPQKPTTANADNAEFKELQLDVNKAGNASPDDAAIKNISMPTETDLKNRNEADLHKYAKLVSVEVLGRYSGFKDGGEVRIRLQGDLQTLLGFQRKGTVITGKGWLIDDRVYIDLGFDSKNVILYDLEGEQGVALPDLKNKGQLVLRVQN